MNSLPCESLCASVSLTLSEGFHSELPDCREGGVLETEMMSVKQG